MRTKPLISIVLLVFFFCIGLSGCTIGNWVQETGTIVFNDFEGGFYGITVGDLKLDPVNLPDEFKIDGLEVQFLGRMFPHTSSFHMWGITFYIIDIERVEGQ